MIRLLCGRWQDVLKDVECDAVITDPPYGARTHGGQRHGLKDARYCDKQDRPNLSARGLGYAPWGKPEIDEFVSHWSPRTRGWMCVFTDSEICPLWREALMAAGRYVFAPLACVQHAMNVRLAGDGPSNWTTWLVVARPRTGFKRWGTLRGAYVGNSNDRGSNALDRSKLPVAGAKPSWLMQAIIGDYTRPGNLIVDPCAGGATTLLAAAITGRSAIGAEMDRETYLKARGRLFASTIIPASELNNHAIPHSA